MKKKIFILMFALVVLTGCSNIDKLAYDDIVSLTINSNEKIYNTYRKGYKFYLPKGLVISEKSDYNEYIRGVRENYYLYVDILGHLNKREFTYEENSTSFYSKQIGNEEKKGYIEINLINSKYLVEIVYNYAKIEVMVEKDDLNTSITNAMIILASINYNDAILENESSTVLNYHEKTIDIFKTHGKEKSNFLEYVEYDEYEEKEIPDYDVIK